MFNRSLATILLFVVLTVTGLGCKNADQVPAEKTKPVVLQYWGVFTDSDDMAILLKTFNKNHPNIKVEYTKFRPEEYNQKLLEAFAEDRGPDIYTIHNTWLKQYWSKLSPMPATLSYPVFTVTGSGMQQKTAVTMGSRPGMTVKNLRDQFVQVVEGDVMAAESVTSSNKAIFALPFYVDSLAMYYNRDLLAQNGIVPPAKFDWEIILEHAEKYTKPLDQDDRAEGLTQSIVALGTGAGVHRAGDILTALMMQSGAPVIQDNGGIGFNLRPANTAADEVLPGVAAMQFYLDFSNPGKKAYTWGPAQGDALDAFAQGKLAYYFGYSYDTSTIRSRNPRLKFDIAPFPVPRGVNVPLTVANYWMEGVSKKSKYKDEAWLFVLETATNKEALGPFLKQTRRASALNEIIQTQFEDLDIGVFARQNLTARNWYRGRNSKAADTIMTEMIDRVRARVITAPEDFDEAKFIKQELDNAASRINDTI